MVAHARIGDGRNRDVRFRHVVSVDRSFTPLRAHGATARPIVAARILRARLRWTLARRSAQPLASCHDPAVARVGTRRPSTFFALPNLTANSASRSDVCALAFEPVPRRRHEVRPRRADAPPARAHRPARALLPGRLIGTASDGTARCYVDAAPYDARQQLGLVAAAMAARHGECGRVGVPVVGLSTLLERHVPAAAKVVAKMDVAGCRA